MTNHTTSNKMLSVVTIAAMMIATATIEALVSQHVAAQSISIPTNNTQQANCDTAGSSSAVVDSCNNKSTNNIANSGGVLDLNTQPRSTITVIKHVINDNSGSAQASDFTITIVKCVPPGKKIVTRFPGSESGTTVALDPAACYFIRDGMPASSAGYDASFTGDCSTLTPRGTSNDFRINEGEQLTCTITNDDVP